jgi:copper oxidase (laccase) domain-containing protein
MGHGGEPVTSVRPEVAARRRAVVDLPWTWLHQIHGAGVVRREGCALAVLTADCAPVALASSEGVIGVAHAGWRGVAAGVIEATVAEMEALGATGIEGAIGPCIHAECYEFGPAELDNVAARLGDDVRATTAAGAPALDLPAAVRAALARAAVERVHDAGVCTACSPSHYSWRARQETQRQATVVWR